jgi:hypothetical protein
LEKKKPITSRIILSCKISRTLPRERCVKSKDKDLNIQGKSLISKRFRKRYQRSKKYNFLGSHISRIWKKELASLSRLLPRNPISSFLESLALES